MTYLIAIQIRFIKHDRTFKQVGILRLLSLQTNTVNYRINLLAILFLSQVWFILSLLLLFLRVDTG